jgi:hypothetical protein
MAQITLNSTGVASSGTLALQSNGTTTAVTIDTAQNMGLGVTPSAWNSDYKPLQIGTTSCVYGRVATNESGLSQNLFRDTSANYKYIGNGYAAVYAQLSGGGHAWFTAPSNSSGAGAALTLTQAMTLDASGNLMVGTTTANGKLAVYQSTSGDGTISVGNAQDVYTCNVGKQGSSAYGATSAGDAFLYTSTKNISIMADGGSSVIKFATGGNTERARIDSSGNLLVGKTSDTNSAAGVVVANSGGSSGLVKCSKTASGTYNALLNYHNGTYIGGVDYSNTATSFPTLSDIRLKKDIVDAGSASAKIDQIRIVSHGWKHDDEVVEFGVIAQELNLVAPQAVTVGDDGEEIEKTWGVDYSKLIPMLVKAHQEQQALITQLQADVEALKGTA